MAASTIMVQMATYQKVGAQGYEFKRYVPCSMASCSAISLNTSPRLVVPFPSHLCCFLPLFRMDSPQVSQI